MRTVKTIIADLKHQIIWSQPNIRFNELNSLVAELENTLFPSEEVVVEEPVVEELVVEEVIEEPTVEEVVEEIEVEETVTEEPVTEKKSSKKK